MVPLAVVQLQVMQVTGTVALVSQVTGVVPTAVASRAAAEVALRITVYVPWVLVTVPTVSSGALRVSSPAAIRVAAVAPATVLTTAAVPLRIPAFGRHCEP